MPSCHSAPGELGTWTARRGCVLPPTVWLDASSDPVHSASLHQSGPDSIGVSPISVGLDNVMPSGIIVALVQTQVLRRFFSGLRPFHHDGLNGRFQELGVMDVGSGYYHTQWAAALLDEDTSFAPSLGAVRGVGTNRIPPKRALPMAQSADCHSQFTPPSSSHPSTKTAQIRCSTPSSTQRWNVR